MGGISWQVKKIQVFQEELYSKYLVSRLVIDLVQDINRW
jgi:hypothetical protein